jgi:hypothetical protein
MKAFSGFRTNTNSYASRRSARLKVGLKLL